MTNLAETFLTFWELVKDKPLPEQISLWETHYARIRPDVLDFYEEHYNDLSTPAGEVFSRYPDIVSAIRTVSAGAETAIVAAVKKCAAVLGVA